MKFTKEELKGLIKAQINERCQEGYKTHPTRKTKEMYGKTYRNCIKAEEKQLEEEDAFRSSPEDRDKDDILGLYSDVWKSIYGMRPDDDQMIAMFDNMSADEIGNEVDELLRSIRDREEARRAAEAEDMRRGEEEAEISRLMPDPDELEDFRKQEPIRRPVNESIDVATVENLEAAIAEAYDEMMTPIAQDQVYADTGDPVSKDPQMMHDKTVEFLMDVVKDVTSGETLNNPRTINEDGHSDVPSAVRAMKTIIEDAAQMLQALEQMGDSSLPTWWTNKMAVSATMMNKMRDYLLIPSEPMEEKKLSKPEEKEKEKIVKGMKKDKSDFKKRYGKDAESVMYATATKLAKEKANESNLIDKNLLKKIVLESIKEVKDRKKIVWRKLKRGHWGRVADTPREGDVVVHENDPIMDMSYAERQQELENTPSNA